MIFHFAKAGANYCRVEFFLFSNTEDAIGTRHFSFAYAATGGWWLVSCWNENDAHDQSSAYIMYIIYIHTHFTIVNTNSGNKVLHRRKFQFARTVACGSILCFTKWVYFLTQFKHCKAPIKKLDSSSQQAARVGAWEYVFGHAWIYIYDIEAD